MSRPYWWFQGASVAQLKEYLNALENVRIDVHLSEAQEMTFEVYGDGGGGTINDSHVCPPQCP